MKTRMRHVLFSLLAASALSAVADELPTLPPLNPEPGTQQLPGKIVWADLFTSDIDAARDFYTSLFGWQWREIADKPVPYGIFSHEGVDVAGLVEWEPSQPQRPYGRWLFYASTPNVDEAVTVTLARGGTVLSPARDVAGRGRFAIVSDPEELPFGFIDSSSGDPADYRARHGDWIWFNLFSRAAEQASEFYRLTAGYVLQPDTTRSDLFDIVLSSQGHARAGIKLIPPVGGNAPAWVGFVRVPDADAAVRRATELGGEVLFTPPADDIPMALLRGPNGAIFGVLEWAYEADGESAP